MNSVEAARQGDSKAIAEVLNHLLKPDNIVVNNACIQGDDLNLFLDTSQVPLPKSSIKRIYDALKKLDVQFIKFVAIAAVNPNNPDEIWKICIDLTKNWENYQSESSTSNKFKWPVWFPYPSSWVRMIILILWLAIVVRVLGFWGLIIGETVSDIVDHPKPLLQAVGLAAVGSILVFSYLYFLVSDKHSSSRKKSFPTARSLWEGTYAMIVLILSFIIAILVSFPFLPWDDCYYSHFYDRLICNYSWHSASENISTFSFFVWLISGLYLYQNEALIPPDLNFEKGVEEASNAAFFVQTAKTQDEWEFVATQWENAINYMKQVQPSDPNYNIAQDRVVKYQKNLEYARLAASKAPE